MTAENALIGKRVVLEVDEPGEWRSRNGTSTIRGRIDRVIPIVDDHALVVSLEESTSFKGISAPDWMLEEYGVRNIRELIASRFWLNARYVGDKTLGIAEGKEIYVNIAVVPPRVDVSSSKLNPRRDLIGIGYGRATLVK